MKMVYAIVTGLLLASVGVVSVWLFLAAAGGDDAWVQTMQCLMARRTQALYGTGAILVLVLLLAFVIIQPQTRDEYLSFDGDGGTVSIRLKAMRDYLTGLRNEFAAVLDLKPRIQVVGDQLDIEVDLQIRGDSRIPELCAVLQERIRNGIEEQIGFTGVREVKLNIQDISGSPPSAEGEPDSPHVG